MINYGILLETIDSAASIFFKEEGGYEMAEKKESVKKNPDLRERVTLRMTKDEKDKLEYWANKAGYSINEFVLRLLERWVDIENGNYQLPTLEVQRLNQLIESQTVMSRNMQALEQVVINGFDSLLSLTRGDNYLLEQTDDGE